MVIHWGLCKQLEFYHKNKWYMHNMVSVGENEMHKLLWDSETQTDHLILARRLGLIIIKNKKRTRWIVNIALLAHHLVQLNESEKKDKYLDLARELKKLCNINVTVILTVIGVLGTVRKGLVKGPENLEIWGRVAACQTTIVSIILNSSFSSLARSTLWHSFLFSFIFNRCSGRKKNLRDDTLLLLLLLLLLLFLETLQKKIEQHTSNKGH